MGQANAVCPTSIEGSFFQVWYNEVTCVAVLCYINDCRQRGLSLQRDTVLGECVHVCMAKFVMKYEIVKI